MNDSLKLRAALLACVVACTGTLRANTAIDWNKTALDTLTATHMDLLAEERAMAITQLAVYEAANAARPAYQRSPLAVAETPGASESAAITEAAYRCLLALLPAAADHSPLDNERTRRLAAIPDSPQKTAGIATGAAASAAVLRSRANDGADFSNAYKPGNGPGVYQPTSDRPMSGPLAWKMRPFVLSTYADFLPPPPPPLDSDQMRRDVAEIAVWGSRESKLRTEDETAFALFHARPGTFAWNSIGRQTAEHLQLGEVETAHLLSLLNITILEAHLSAWDAKYAYNLWRPVTALHAGGGPLQLKPDPAWTPLIATPMIPEYPCAHCALGAAAQTVLEGIVGRGPMELTVENAGVTRHYTSFRQYAEEESASRMYAGVHYRWSNAVGDTLGREVGTVVLEKAALPIGRTAN